MKNSQKYLLWVLCCLLTLCAGLYLGKYLFEPAYSVGMVRNHSEMFAERAFKVQGRVSHKKLGVEGLLKVYWLCDDLTGECIPVKTPRVILPRANSYLCIKARLKEPWVFVGFSQLLLVEEADATGWLARR